MRESERISVLKGVGEKTEQLFIKAGVHTIGDLLAYYPRMYDIYEDPISIGEIQEGKTVTVTGAIFGRIQVSQNKKMQITTLYLKDMTGTLKVIWFRMPFLRNTLGRGGVITLRGRIVRKKDALVMEHPEIFYPSASYEEKRNTMQPVYALTAGLTNNAVKKAVAQALEQVEKLLEKEVIEIAPLAYMRGRTLDNAFIILDEAQNTTRAQMKMFLTRMGFHSRIVITGDVTQIDLIKKRDSGLLNAKHLLSGIEGISFVELTSLDVVRNPLVQKIIERYEQEEERYGKDFID